MGITALGGNKEILEIEAAVEAYAARPECRIRSLINSIAIEHFLFMMAKAYQGKLDTSLPAFGPREQWLYTINGQILDRNRAVEETQKNIDSVAEELREMNEEVDKMEEICEKTQAQLNAHLPMPDIETIVEEQRAGREEVEKIREDQKNLSSQNDEVTEGIKKFQQKKAEYEQAEADRISRREARRAEKAAARAKEAEETSNTHRAVPPSQPKKPEGVKPQKKVKWLDRHPLVKAALPYIIAAAIITAFCIPIILVACLI